MPVQNLPMQVLQLLILLHVVLAHTMPVKLLVLVPWPSDRPDAAWDVGLDLLAAARVAVNEINSATDLLVDYHIELVVPENGTEACGLTETNQGLLNFVKHSMYPPGQVLAVLGLYCSPSTKEISSLAGHDSVQLIHLSAANSPIFHPDNSRLLLQRKFPHLWRFLVSAGIYADMMIELINQFDWNDIVIVYAEEHRFYAGIVDMLEKRIVSDNVTKISFTSSSDIMFHNNVLDTIEQIGRIIFFAATNSQIVNLLCAAAKRGMLYPDYMWIIPDRTLPRLELLVNDTQCSVEMLRNALNGTILSFVHPRTLDDNLTLVSGNTYSTYKSRYYKELEKVAVEYNMALNGDLNHAGILYDQVWAIALALNSSIPQLIEFNLSINDIGSLGYSYAKEILEDELLKVNFSGASAHIRFSEEREVSNSIDLYQVINGKQNSVGECAQGDLDDTIVLHCNVTLAETPPSSEFDKVYVHVSWIIVLGLLFVTILVTLLVSLALVLFVYHRNRPEIKAASLKLSMLLFIACYILCVHMLVVALQSLNNHMHIAYCYIQPILLFNGLNLFLITLFLKILRVHRIFHNRLLKDLGWSCSNIALILGSIALTAVPNIFFILWYALDHKILGEDSQFISAYVVIRHYQVVETCQQRGSDLLIFLPDAYLLFFTLGSIVLATRTAKIYEHFKDTKKVNFLMATLFVVSVGERVIIVLVSLVTTGIEKHTIILVSKHLYSGLMVGLIFFFIFIPKLLWMRKYIIKCRSRRVRDYQPY